ncbi:MAG: Uma2 family endonuclease [Polyangiaceae bacterium]|nr:Uma2 family endonuclease [Polyangiaceae bacterium]
MVATATAEARQLLTARDLDDVPDDGNRYEVIDGELYVSPFPDEAHQRATKKLFAALHAHVKAHALGRVYPAGLKVVLDEPTGVGPDIVFVSNTRLDGLHADGFHGAPELVVEVVSSKPQLDRRIKLQKYARSGIPHYWIVDPKLRSLVAYKLDGDRYRAVAEHGARERFEPELFPGLVLALGDLWE